MSTMMDELEKRLHRLRGRLPGEEPVPDASIAWAEKLLEPLAASGAELGMYPDAYGGIEVEGQYDEDDGTASLHILGDALIVVTGPRGPSRRPASYFRPGEEAAAIADFLSRIGLAPKET